MTENVFIVHAPNRDRYTPIDHVTLRDPRLSWAATGLLAYLLTLPKDWRVNLEHLAGQKDGHGTGIKGTSAALRELEAAGYVEKRKIRNDAGEIVRHTVLVRERTDVPWPTEEPILPFTADGCLQPFAVKATSGERQATKELTTKKDPVTRKAAAVEIDDDLIDWNDDPLGSDPRPAVSDVADREAVDEAMVEARRQARRRRAS